MKQQQYPAESGSIISFKIDFRILLHHHHYQDHDRKYEKDIDLEAGEAAKNIEEAKVKADHLKLAREAKDVLDRLSTLMETKLMNLKGCNSVGRTAGRNIHNSPS
ncbi:hypothetical protein BCR42DRAFT_226573 [Absidia repens]|uniref:Uncharacterized protein n=1 Tax=Absidia repens TaxID=90262 RepID=A0A1X2HDU6_9FUNG|nr:hypothetical protein BCR42DRAFT_226573 [Absidia repens]